MGLSELIAQYDSDNPDELTLAILPVVLEDEDLVQSIVIPALRSAIVHTIRLAALNAEKGGMLSNHPTADPSADRLAFLAERFYAPPWGLITWGEATIEQHQARIDYLNKKVNGLVDTITRHDNAIQELRQAGAKNLAEIHGKRRRTRKKAS